MAERAERADRIHRVAVVADWEVARHQDRLFQLVENLIQDSQAKENEHE